jgi:hypothetical protein
MSALKKTFVPVGVVGPPCRSALPLRSPDTTRRMGFSAPSGMLPDLRCTADAAGRHWCHGRRVNVICRCKHTLAQREPACISQAWQSNGSYQGTGNTCRGPGWVACRP